MKTKFLCASLLIYSVGVYAGDAGSGADSQSKKEAEAKAKSEGDAKEKAACFKPLRFEHTEKQDVASVLLLPHSPTKIFPLVMSAVIALPAKGRAIFHKHTLGALGSVSEQQSYEEPATGEAATYKSAIYATSGMAAAYKKDEETFSQHGGIQLTGGTGKELADNIWVRLIDFSDNREHFIKEPEMSGLRHKIETLFKQQCP